MLLIDAASDSMNCLKMSDVLLNSVSYTGNWINEQGNKYKKYEHAHLLAHHRWVTPHRGTPLWGEFASPEGLWSDADTRSWAMYARTMFPQHLHFELGDQYIAWTRICLQTVQAGGIETGTECLLPYSGEVSQLDTICFWILTEEQPWMPWSENFVCCELRPTRRVPTQCWIRKFSSCLLLSRNHWRLFDTCIGWEKEITRHARQRTKSRRHQTVQERHYHG